MAGDPDPGKTLADIRTLLVGPTRGLHDAMFEEVIDILEESDREVQNALQSLESNYYRLSDITDNLITASVETRDQARQQTEVFQEELQKSVAGQQEMLSEMFMAIDAKIAEMSAKVDRKIEGIANKLEAAMREAAISQERASQALEARCLATASQAIDLLETRLGHLERTSSTDQAVIREVFADGLLNIADRFKTLRHS
jgi:S-adenosylmethionine:tRNA-ribosyltransferase-isomerase (queuine synthetase)